MKNKVFRSILGVAAVFYTAALFSSGAVASYPSAMDCDGRNSFNWYCSEPKPKRKKPEPIEEVKEAPKPEKVPELSYEEQKLKEFKELQQRLEDLKQIAIIDPTEANVSKYIAEQLRVQKMASMFADVWKRVQWADPSLDYSIQHPTMAAAKRVALDEKRNAVNQNLKDLSAEGWGIWFFYSSTCSYCAAMSEAMNLIDSQGMQVQAISLDGRPLQGLRIDFIVNSGQAEELGVTMTPTVFLANLNTRDVAPISYGAASYQELIERIYVITRTEPGERF